MRKPYLDIIKLHILHIAEKESFFSTNMIEKLNGHGYKLNRDKLYSLLNQLEIAGLLVKETRIVEGKRKKYYCITTKGLTVLFEAKQRIEVIVQEIVEV